MTQGGSEDASWNFPSQGRDGKTVVSHRDTFEGGSKRPVLYLYGADGKLVTANVMPRLRRRASAGLPDRARHGLELQRRRLRLLSTAASPAGSLYKGFWLTFSDNQGAFPSDPQGQSDAFNPTFYKTRVVFRDSGGNIFVQPDVAEAPFTSSYQGWITHGDGYFLSRAEVSPANDQVAIDWIRDDGATGITVAQHSGTVPSDLVAACDLPAAGKASYATFSPDGSQMAWTDDEGLKVAGVPNLAAGTDTCTLTAPAHVISATGRMPSFGGADVDAVSRRRRRRGRGRGGGGGAKPARPRRRRSASASPARPPAPRSPRASRSRSARTGAGRIDASAAIAKKVGAQAAPQAAAPRAARIATRGFAAASTVTVARGHAKAKRAGTVKIRLKPTKAAKRAAKRMRKVVLTIKVSQPGAAGKATVRSSSRAGGARRQQLGEHPPQRGDVLVGEEAAEALLEGGGEHRAHVGERRRPLAGQLGPHDAPVMRRDPPGDPAALLQAVDQPRGAAAADEQGVGELVHRQPPAGRDHEPVDGLVLEQRGPRPRLEPPAQLAAQQAVGAVQLGPRRQPLEVPPRREAASTLDDGKVDGGKTAACSAGGREVELAQAIGDLRAPAVQAAHDRADRDAERVAALGVGEAEHVDRDERLAVRAVELVDGVEHGRGRPSPGRARASWRASVLADLVERGGRRAPRWRVRSSSRQRLRSARRR